MNGKRARQLRKATRNSIEQHEKADQFRPYFKTIYRKVKKSYTSDRSKRNVSLG